MVLSILRVLFGFFVACLAAGFAIVLFVYTPLELAMDSSDRMSEAMMLALAVATHGAVFAAPFALVGAAVGEWRSITGWTYYALVGILIAVVGFLVQYSNEASSAASILNSYALSAFLVSGLVAGLVYWLFAGRFAGDPSGSVPVNEATSPPRNMPGRPMADEA